MTNYRRGYALELRAKKELEIAGYYVMRSSGSHGACDLIALNQEEIRLIQVGTAGSKRPVDYEKLRRVPAPGKVFREMWLWTARLGWTVEMVAPQSP